MTTRQMRTAISKVYPNELWKDKVRNMSDNQVIAVYYSFLERGAFNRKKPTPKPQEEVRRFEPYIGEQLSLFEYF